jgi:hypothetical protein
LVNKDQLSKSDLIKVTAGIKMVSNQITSEILSGEILLNPKRLNLVEINDRLTQGYEEVVTLRSQVVDLSDLRSQRNFGIGIARGPALMPESPKRRLSAVNIHTNIYSELNYEKGEKIDPELCKAEKGWLDGKAVDFVSKMKSISKNNVKRFGQRWKDREEKILADEDRLKNENLEKISERLAAHQNAVKVTYFFVYTKIETIEESCQGQRGKYGKGFRLAL